MILRNVPPAILAALGLGCGPTASEADDSGSISQGETIGSDDDDDSDVGPCLSQPEEVGEEEDDGEVGPCLSECLDTSGGFISASSDGSGDSDSTGTDSTGTDSTGTDGTGTDTSGTDTSGSGSSSDDGSESSTSGGTQDASARARAWRDALSKMESVGALPRDVLAKLRAQKGPR